MDLNKEKIIVSNFFRFSRGIVYVCITGLLPRCKPGTYVRTAVDVAARAVRAREGRCTARRPVQWRAVTPLHTARPTRPPPTRTPPPCGGTPRIATIPLNALRALMEVNVFKSTVNVKWMYPHPPSTLFKTNDYSICQQ